MPNHVPASIGCNLSGAWKSDTPEFRLLDSQAQRLITKSDWRRKYANWRN